MFGEKTIAMLAAAKTASEMTSTGRLPHWSESGPSSSCPRPMPMRNAVRVSCTEEGCAPRSRAIEVNDARYMSVAKGPTAARNESTARSPGVSLGGAAISGSYTICVDMFEFSGAPRAIR
jgi:hypothetical protein